jgi:hypothetical protein
MEVNQLDAAPYSKGSGRFHALAWLLAEIGRFLADHDCVLHLAK